jgi:hypothetical protein
VLSHSGMLQEEGKCLKGEIENFAKIGAALRCAIRFAQRQEFLMTLWTSRD